MKDINIKNAKNTTVVHGNVENSTLVSGQSDTKKQSTQKSNKLLIIVALIAAAGSIISGILIAGSNWFSG